MSEVHRLVLPALFHEALTGDFRPATDPEGRTRKLSRLVIASFVKGERLPSDSLVSRYTKVYDPSWAPGVTSAISYHSEFGHDTVGALSLSAEGLGLDPLNLRLVSQLDADETQFNQIVVVSHDAEEVTAESLPIDYGDNLTLARRAITEQAQAFFDQLTSPATS